MILLRLFRLKYVQNMSSLIVNKVKIKSVYSELNSFLYALFTGVTVANLCNIHVNNYNLSAIQPFCKHQHLFIRSLQWGSLNHDCSPRSTHLNYYYISFSLSCPFIVPHKSLTNFLKVECSFSCFLEKSIATLFLFVYCVHIGKCCVGFSLSISFILILMVLLVYL